MNQFQTLIFHHLREQKEIILNKKKFEIFDQFRRKHGRPKKMKEGWLGLLNNSILNLFNKPQKTDFKLVLEKSASKSVTKKDVINDPGNYDPVTF